MSFSPDGALDGPSGGDIDAIDCIYVSFGGGFTAMGDGIDFEESWYGFIPLVGFDGDASLDDGAGFGGGESAFGVFGAFFGHESIDGGGRDG